LGNDRRWQFQNDHFKKSFGSIDPLLEDFLHEKFSLEGKVVIFEYKPKRFGHFVNFLHLTLHSSFAESNDRLHDEADKGSVEFLASFFIWLVVVLPFLGFGVKVVVAPKLFHHLYPFDAELFGICVSKFGNGEGPAEKS